MILLDTQVLISPGELWPVAGMAAILQLLPFSVLKAPKVNMLHGFEPRSQLRYRQRPESAGNWEAIPRPRHDSGGGHVRTPNSPADKIEIHSITLSW